MMFGILLPRQLRNATRHQLSNKSRTLTSSALPSFDANNNSYSAQVFNLTKKVIIVAGSGSNYQGEWGIGSTTSILLARLGAQVVSVSRSKSASLEDQFNIDKTTGVCMAADCTKKEDVEDLINRVMEKYGRIDTMINAGIHLAKTNGIDKMDKDQWDVCINSNLNAQYHLIKATLPVFRKQKSGNIIFYSTIAANRGLGLNRQRHGYAASKAASGTLTKMVGIENAKNGIRANVISIGYTDGALVSRAISQANADKDIVTAKRDSYVPRGYQGSATEIANTAAFLASDASSFINATNLHCDGGSHSVTYG